MSWYKKSRILLFYPSVLRCEVFPYKTAIKITAHWNEYIFRASLRMGRPSRLVIYSCLPPDRIWHKIFFYCEDFSEGGQAPSLVPCWTLLVISSLGTAWVKWPYEDLDSPSAMWVQHVCLLIAWTKPEDLCSVKDFSPTWRWLGRSWGSINIKSITDLYIRDGPAK